MKNKKLRLLKLLVVFLSLVALIIIYYYPFETDKKCGESSLCWVKFGVYTYDYNSEAGASYFGKDIQFGEKVGGVYEYLGLKEISCAGI
jgi:hypothetical protein